MADTDLVSWMKAASWLNIILGVVAFFAPIFAGESAAGYANAMIVGIIVFVLAVIEETGEANGRTGRVIGTSIVNILAGIWLIALPYAIQTTSGFMATCITVGIVLIVAEVFNLSSSSVLQHRHASM